MTNYHLAEINIGRLRAPVDDPMIADFVANLDRINALAEGSPGFVWRLTGEGNNATDIQPDPSDPLMAINMSVWESAAALGAFVYRSDHQGVMRRRKEWFEKLDKDRFRRDLGNVIESYTEVARRLGIMKEMPTVIQGGLH